MDGIINVYKEAGYTSFDVVAKLRGILKQKKIGHTGTLDPDAEGVLPVCIGKATKVCEYLTEKDKIYEAVLHLGITTDTEDITGTIIKEQKPELSEEQLLKIILSFTGKQRQVPPMYSALKVNGQKLCDLARKGIEVERKEREIEIYSIEVLSIQMPLVKMRVHCSKGTYIRTLCHDIGKEAGCGGCMEKLLRVKTGGFTLEQAHRIGEIEEIVKNPGTVTLSDILIPADEVLTEYPKIHADAAAEKLLKNGNRIPVHLTDFDLSKEHKYYRLYDASGGFVGIFTYHPVQKDLKPEKMFLIP